MVFKRYSGYSGEAQTSMADDDLTSYEKSNLFLPYVIYVLLGWFTKLTVSMFSFPCPMLSSRIQVRQSIVYLFRDTHTDEMFV